MREVTVYFMKRSKLKLYGFNNLTKTLSFNMYDVCYASTEEERKKYIAYIDEQYSAERLTGILQKVADTIGAQVLNIAQQDYDPQGASVTMLIAEEEVEKQDVVAHLDKSHITVHTYPEMHPQDGICTFRADIDVSTCGKISPLKALNFLLRSFEADIVITDYRVRGFTRDVKGKKIFIDHRINSIQNYMAPDLRHAYDLIDVNVYQENIFHTKMLLHDFKLDNYLFDMTEKDLSPKEVKRIRRLLKQEMYEIFNGSNMPDIKDLFVFFYITRRKRMDTAELKKEAIALRKEKHQMIKTALNADMKNGHDLAIVYTPGVSAPCLEIKKDEDLSLEMTWRGNVVAVISDGTRVLGLGDIGAAAAMPVMEGKSALYKRFGNIDAIPIVLDTKDKDEFIHTVKLLEKNFAGINLEDISSPKCYDIEDELKKIMNIPVFHDDQHGTAIAALAALLGALKVTGKKIDEIKVVMNGAGAAGTAIARLLLEDGVKPENMTILNSKGILYDNGKRDRVQLELIHKTNPENKQGTFAEAVKGADVLIGCSAPGVFNNDAIKTMADKSIVFAMANPVPEIMEEEAKEKGVYIYGSGRSDMHNQVNNSSVFPGLFRGALDVRARQINEEMKLAAAHALADLATKCQLDPDHVVVDVFDERVPHEVAKAVAKAAIASGVARVTELPEQYKD